MVAKLTKVTNPEKTPGPTCSEVLDDLFSLVEGELPDDEAAVLLRHLTGCKSCRAAMTQHARLAGMLREHMPFVSKPLMSPYYRPYN